MNYLKEILEEKHITQKELSIRTGIPRTTINRYYVKKNKRPMSLELAYNIALALDIEIDEFIGGILND